MDISEAMKTRHSVRSYSDRPIPEDIVRILKQEAENCNLKSGLRIQVITDEASAFEGFMAHYGNFRGVKNYIALVGKKSDEEKAGYFGEHLALKAQALGLNTCWVAMTFKKSACKRNCRIEKGEKLLCVLALGYGAAQGVPHKNRAAEEIAPALSSAPDWFRNGTEAALLAPTALNSQKFRLEIEEEKVRVSAWGPYARINLGIVKYHFEAGAGKDNFQWA